MSARIDALVRRREALIARSAAQRAWLAVEIDETRRGLWLLEGLSRGVRAVRSRPLVSAVVAGAIVLTAPRRLLRGVVRGIVFGGSLIRLGRSLRAVLLKGGGSTRQAPNFDRLAPEPSDQG